jgi:hypothetical protein
MSANNDLARFCFAMAVMGNSVAMVERGFTNSPFAIRNPQLDLCAFFSLSFSFHRM